MHYRLKQSIVLVIIKMQISCAIIFYRFILTSLLSPLIVVYI